MGREQVEVVKRSVEAWNRGDLDALVAESAADAEWVPAEENAAAGIRRGRDEIRGYLEDWRDTIQGMRYEVSTWVDLGDTVVSLGTVSGRAGADGPEVKVTLAVVTRFEGAVPVRTEEYLDRERALEAAGARARC